MCKLVVKPKYTKKMPRHSAYSSEKFKENASAETFLL